MSPSRVWPDQMLTAILCSVAVVCFLIFFNQHFEVRASPGRYWSELTLGYPGSPWLHRVRDGEEVATEIFVLSVSGLCGLVGASCFAGALYAHWRRRRTGRALEATAGSTTS